MLLDTPQAPPRNRKGSACLAAQLASVATSSCLTRTQTLSPTQTQTQTEARSASHRRRPAACQGMAPAAGQGIQAGLKEQRCGGQMMWTWIGNVKLLSWQKKRPVYRQVVVLVPPAIMMFCATALMSQLLSPTSTTSNNVSLGSWFGPTSGFSQPTSLVTEAGHKNQEVFFITSFE